MFSLFIKLLFCFFLISEVSAQQTAPPRPWIGIYVESQTSYEYGMRVTEIAERRASEAAGILPGDVIYNLNGKKIETTNDLIEGVKELSIGMKFSISLMRTQDDDVGKSLSLTIIPLEKEKLSSDLPSCPTEDGWHNCFGTFTYDDGSKYVGEYQNRNRNGIGILTYADGSVKHGFFKDNALLVEQTLPSCPTVDGYHNCFGTFTYDDGNTYIGEYQNKYMNGNGILTYADGTAKYGVFADNVLIEGDTETIAQSDNSNNSTQNASNNYYDECKSNNSYKSFKRQGLGEVYLDECVKEKEFYNSDKFEHHDFAASRGESWAAYSISPDSWYFIFHFFNSHNIYYENKGNGFKAKNRFEGSSFDLIKEKLDRSYKSVFLDGGKHLGDVYLTSGLSMYDVNLGSRGDDGPLYEDLTNNIISEIRDMTGITLGPNWRTKDLRGGNYPEWEKKHLQVMGLIETEQKEIQPNKHAYRNGMFEYEKGNYARAYQYFEAAHEYRPSAGGCFNLEYKLGIMNQYGQGTNKDYKKAIKHFNLSSYLCSNARSQVHLGMLYEHGLGVSRNLTNAYMWYLVAYYGSRCHLKASYGEYSKMTDDEQFEYDEKERVCITDREPRMDKISPEMSTEEKNRATLLAKQCMGSNFESCGD